MIPDEVIREIERAIRSPFWRMGPGTTFWWRWGGGTAFVTVIKNDQGGFGYLIR